jgi:ABC-type nitrate/sulfonate/bicarbonate transport system ATPase subunit
MVEAAGHARPAPATPADEPPLVDLSHAGFTYPDGTTAVGDVTLEVRRNSITSIVGPSGCGKTTLLRLLSELQRPTRGRVTRILGDNGTRHGCSMVFQEDTLLPWLRVRDNVALYYRFSRKRGSRVDEHVDRLLEMVGLRDYADAFPSKLSGGMRRRVAVLTAIAPLPSLLLLDEPFSALDEPTRMALHNDLHALVREFEIGAILVTHDLAEAITLSDQVILLSRAPARIVGRYDIPFGRDRDVFSLRGRRDYLDLYGNLWADLEREIKAEPGATGEVVAR